jgi:YD repeat-containing protein
LGFGWTHSYNVLLAEQSDGTVAIKQGDGHWDFYSPTAAGGYQSDVPCIRNTLVKNPNGMFNLTMPDQSQLQFNTNGNLARTTDRNGNALGFSYDAAGNLRTVIDTVGRNVTLGYDTQNRLTQITDPIGRTIQYTYDSASNLIAQTDPNGRAMRYSYDVDQQVIQIIDQNNNILVRNVYDQFFRVISQTNGRGFTTTFAYDTPGPRQTRIRAWFEMN